MGLFAGSLLRQVNGNQLTVVFFRKSRGGLSYQGQDLSTRSPMVQAVSPSKEETRTGI